MSVFFFLVWFPQEWLLKDLEAIEHPTEEQLVRMREYRRVIGKRRRRISRKNARKAKRDRRRARGDANYVSTDSDEEFVDLVRPTDDSSSEATSESDSEGSSAPANSGASGASVANAIETC